MIFEALLIGLIIGFATNGRLHFLTEIEFKGWTLVLLGAILQVIPIALTDLTVKNPILQWTPVVGMGAMLLAVVVNWRLKGFRIIFIGALLNILVMMLHMGKMPIHVGVLEFAGLTDLAESVKENFVVNYVSFDQAPSLLKWLGKCIPIPKPYPFARVLSVGDVLITIGIIRFASAEMVRFHFKKKGRMLRYSYKP